MNWDAIGAIGQLLGSVAVLISIAYLALQVRHARDEMRRSAVLTRLEGTRDLFLMQATDERLMSVITRAEEAAGFQWTSPVGDFFTGELGLNAVDARRLRAWVMASWNNFETSIESMDRLSPGVRREVDFHIRGNYRDNALLAKWFALMKEQLNPNSVRYVEKLLADPVEGTR